MAEVPELNKGGLNQESSQKTAAKDSYRKP
jgi:hypothetical protein